MSALDDLTDNIDMINDRAGRQRIDYNDSDDYEAAAACLVFLAVMGMAIESLAIILRILNVSLINQYFPLFEVGVSNSTYLVM